MILGVISDTHGHVPFARPAVHMLQSFQVEQVVHCGDIGSTEIVALFAPFTMHYVLGNVDRQTAALQDAIARAGGTLHGRFGHFELAHRQIAFLHGDEPRRLRKEIDSGRWDLICYGHTHQARQERQGRTVVLNPGALFRAPSHSIAVVDLQTMEVNVLPV